MRAPPLPARLAIGFFFVLVVGTLGGVARKQALEIVRGAAHVRDVQVGRLLWADVDEGGLHAREHALDPALVDVAGDPPFALSLDVELAEETVFDEGDACFGTVGVDDEEARHSGSHQILRAARVRADGNVRVHGRSLATERLV